MKTYPHARGASRLRQALLSGLAALAFAGLQAQPTTNPVTDSGIDTGVYDTSWIAALPWTTVYDVTTDTTLTPAVVVPNDGVLDSKGLLTAGDDLAVVQAKIDALSALGGGVLYFPAGDYHFSDTLYLADGVIIRGATPAQGDCRGTYTMNGNVRIYDGLTYDPPTNFLFPVYIHDNTDDMSLTGTLRHKFFKRIEVRNPTTASNYGIVNVDISGAAISVGDRAGTGYEANETWGYAIPKNLVSAKNILIFGNRINNAQILEPRIPRADEISSGALENGKKYFIATFVPGADFTPAGAPPDQNKLGGIFTGNGGTPTWNGSRVWVYYSGTATPGSTRQNLWQIWPTRTRGKIDVVSGGNTLIANNIIGDLHYKYYVLGSVPASAIADYTAVLNKSVSPPPKTEQYLADNGGTITIVVETGKPLDDVVRFSDGYGIRLNHVLDYFNAHSAVQEPSKHREGQGVINNWHFGTTRVGFMAAGNGLIVKGNVREDFTGTKWEYIREDGRALQTNNSATQENRGIDITGGDDVIVQDNYVRVKRGTWNNSNYMTVDGEGVLLQESSSTMHPKNWTVLNNTAHSYLGIYRVIHADGILFEGNTVYGDPIYTDGSRNNSIGHTGGTVAFKNNSATAIYSKANLRPRNFAAFDLGGNSPAVSVSYGGNGASGPTGPFDIDAIPGVSIIYPSKGDPVVEGTTIDVLVKVTRHPNDVTPVAGVKLWDGVTNYPANGQMPDTYWTFDGSTPGQPKGIELTLVDPDPVTGAIGGGIYKGSWTVPTGYNTYGLLVAEARLQPQTAGTSSWTQRAWGFRAEVVPVGTEISLNGSNMDIVFATEPGKKYRLEYSDDTIPVGGNNDLLRTWIPVDGMILGDGTNKTFSYAAPAAGKSRFLRVSVTN